MIFNNKLLHQINKNFEYFCSNVCGHFKGAIINIFKLTFNYNYPGRYVEHGENNNNNGFSNGVSMGFNSLGKPLGFCSGTLVCVRMRLLSVRL